MASSGQRPASKSRPEISNLFRFKKKALLQLFLENKQALPHLEGCCSLHVQGKIGFCHNRKWKIPSDYGFSHRNYVSTCAFSCGPWKWGHKTRNAEKGEQALLEREVWRLYSLPCLTLQRDLSYFREQGAGITLLWWKLKEK